MNNGNGSKGTFVITIHNDQNATWQGTIKWVDQKKSLSFRSALEMLTLIDGALERERSDGETETKPDKTASRQP